MPVLFFYYVVAVFDDETSEIVERLFSKLYKDHGLFYTELQTFKLHLHCHYSSMYKMHGLLCNIGCFGQENFIGFVSVNYHGARYYDDFIMYHYNIDFCLENRKQAKATTDGPCDPLTTWTNDYDYVQQIHYLLCNCNSLDSCCVIYRRFIIRCAMVHSLI
ncbi:unnamed protein product [Rotaria sp. Silwood2]|nr:unnamed protein product [Rotaria sp. Silwood2]CAF2738951.1 unnamed protein product [Rotaria sp. Silwood2]CAF3100981.1 unnamed protein product [Rotaria sp. Silwood2]CAF3128412.1 unnamed protein product [Rotaria sp. Silwood2]CAF4049772.1 unnamed protein product [Rotaria sp. Silwood2]